MKLKAIISDLDGTLCQVNNRVKYIDSGEWDYFHTAGCMETPNQWCLDILHRFKKDHRILIVTGRPITYLEETHAWLLDRCYFRPNDYDLFMAPPGMVDIKYKPLVYQQYIQPKFQVEFVLDDRPSLVEAWRAMGLVCLQPNFVDH